VAGRPGVCKGGPVPGGLVLPAPDPVPRRW
jgi:hypothetical protein